MRGRSNGKEERCWPSQEQGDGMREQRSDPAEIPLYVAVAVELSVSLGEKGAGEEESEEKEDDPANLAGERRAGGLIGRVPGRAS